MSTQLKNALTPRIDRAFFFDQVKKKGLFKTLSEKQVAGMGAIIDEFERLQLTDLRWLAYIFATVYHETYDWQRGVREMYPTDEKGGEKYLKSKPYYPYYGRDFCHTTWLRNYEKVKEFTGVDVVKHPDKIAELGLAAKVIVHFMMFGLYTGKRLGDYINSRVCDYLYARRIINGTDKAAEIAGHATKFEASLKFA